MKHQDMLRELNEDMTETVMPVTVFVGLQIVLNFFGNLIVMYVFLFRYRHCSFRYFVTCLAGIDFISSLTTLHGEIVLQNFWYIFPSNLLCKTKAFFDMCTVTAEALCLLTIAVDRYRKVCKPLRWQIKPSLAKTLCFADVFSALVLSVPVSIYTGTREYTLTVQNHTTSVTVCDMREDHVGTNTLVIYNIAIQATISVLLLSLIVLNILIVRRIRKIQNGKRNASESLTIEQSVKNDSDVSSQKQCTESQSISISVSKEKSLTADDCSKNHTEQSRSSCGDISSDANVANLPQENRNNKDEESPKSQHEGKKKQSLGQATLKTRIMFVLTLIFALTTVLYLTLMHVKAMGKIDVMSHTGKAAFLFFFRIVSINHVINPFVYGFMDSKFKREVQRIFCLCKLPRQK